jgi:hypothetical protein
MWLQTYSREHNLRLAFLGSHSQREVAAATRGHRPNACQSYGQHARRSKQRMSVHVEPDLIPVSQSITAPHLAMMPISLTLPPF